MDWNKDYIPQIVKHSDEWQCTLSNEDIRNLLAYYMNKPVTCEKRNLGIMMACYDKDNAKLKYPIKIVSECNIEYKDADISKADPNQGFLD